MNDERAMILKMLQEGKISVEEADALLDVLNESEAAEGDTGFASADSGAGRDRHNDRGAHEAPGRDSGQSDRSAAHVFVEHSSEGEEHGHGIHMDFDFSSLKDALRTTMGSVRDTMRGVSDSLKDAFHGFDFEFSGFGPTMGRERSDDERTFSAEAGEHGTLVISNKWGDVRVTGVDRASISGTARISCWGETAEDARELLEQTHVRLERRDEGWVLESDLGSGHRTRIDLEVEVPRAFDVSVSTASGDLWLESLTGSQTVNTMSGDISVATLGSDADDRQSLSTKSGDVVAAALTGNVKLNSLSGDVSVDGFTGSLDASTKSGDIRITGGHGSVQLNALSGDIAVTLEEIGPDPIRLTSISGDTRLVLPAGASLDVEAKCASGDLRVELDLEDAERSKRSVRGTANGGAIRLEISSVSGDVRVTEA